jgi:hypothetical protein
VHEAGTRRACLAAAEIAGKSGEPAAAEEATAVAHWIPAMHAAPIRQRRAGNEEAQRFWDDNDDRIAEQAYDERLADLREFKAQIPDPPRSFADIVVWAEIAIHEEPRSFFNLAIELVMAIRQFAGGLLPDRMHTRHSPGR